MKSIAGLCCFILLLFTSCKKNGQGSTRSFYLGVTPWPADFTEQELNNAYNFINNNCDIVSHHFDEGIPYEEAYTNTNWPAGLAAEINTRVAKTAAGKKVLLSSSALALTRKQKAPYSRFSETISATVKQQWENLPVNDAKVVTAYTNYIIYLTNSLQPSFINYGVESNFENWPAADFNLYKDFLHKVFANLKAKFPSVPLMVSFMTSESPQSVQLASELLPYTDYVALSAYPYTHVSSSADGNTNPALFPSNYFTKYIDLAPAKPFCFAETGYIAEPLVVPSFSLNKQGNEGWQKDYLEKVCNLVNERKGKFVIWFCSKDYDAGNNTLRSLSLYQDLFALWEDTGLKDENDKQRPSFVTWNNWLKRKRPE